MAASVLLPTVTTGNLGLWNGTKDGQPGYIDYGNATTNVNPFKEVNITCHDIRHLKNPPRLLKSGYEMKHHPTAIALDEFLQATTPEGKARIEDVYFKECVDIIKSLTGDAAGEIIPMSFRIREESKDLKAKMQEANARYAPRPIAHLDRDLPTATTVLREYVILGYYLV